jgi:hypothetical protein
MFKMKRMLLIYLALLFTGGGDHHQQHDRSPSQSRVRRLSLLHSKVIKQH